MSFEFFIALRYLKAKRKQVFVSIITFLSIGGIALGVAALIIVLAVMNGFETDLRNKILGMNSHVLLMEYTGPMKNHGEVSARVGRVADVEATTPFIYTQAMLKSRSGVTGVVLRGLAPESAFRVISLGKIKAGRVEHLVAKARKSLPIPKEDAELPGILVGKELAKNLGIYLHDSLTVVSPQGISTPMGMVPKMKRFLVTGIFDSGFYEYDSTLAYINLQDAQEFLDMPGSVTGLEIKVKDLYRADIVAKEIEKALGYPFWARNWMEMNKNLFAALRLEKRVMFIILSLIVLVAAFNIITTLIMVVMEKSKDIAVLKSMGATERNIMKIFVFQGLIIGAVGTCIGAAAGLAIAFNLADISLFVERMLGIKILPGDVYYLTELPSKVNYGDVAMIIIGAMTICLLATIYPSRRAAQMDPAEALRYD
ncbi:MAG TPA: lipoprotein-releasing ABC transporter permease subunit [Syntrophales bacterium]|jgi:lipoprotein-releasing system permease protein|nr:lipoprotein-releasing ABC transporter permease subunit [Syntrophales bacterium]HON23079.1 lipoprotein-releasing ABC transporter permease subunit [Syntrophales bacterium]HOU78365.1 lipoprotein-releasing ABC transporter permease subunit [Syntrophales bacterium]HPC33473.1 lipoprotein-releasing ABC transporter permease subunit [Syntrophales bacterium]HQG34837.1 lipoprotein-releasing ABC transporter permease subunit [Syntrophales bacterium]